MDDIVLNPSFVQDVVSRFDSLFGLYGPEGETLEFRLLRDAVDRLRYEYKDADDVDSYLEEKVDARVSDETYDLRSEIRSWEDQVGDLEDEVEDLKKEKGRLQERIDELESAIDSVR